MSTTAQDMTGAERIAQLAAEFAYACGTSEDNRVAMWNSEVYRAADAAYRAAMRTAFSLTPAELDQARELLAEYGPHDGAYGTPYPADVRGHAIVAREQVAERIADEAEREVHRLHPAGDADQAEWAVYHRGAKVCTAWLADAQVVTFWRMLPGPAFGIRPVADGEPPADAPVITFTSTPAPSYLAMLAREHGAPVTHPATF